MVILCVDHLHSPMIQRVCYRHAHCMVPLCLPIPLPDVRYGTLMCRTRLTSRRAFTALRCWITLSSSQYCLGWLPITFSSSHAGFLSSLALLPILVNPLRSDEAVKQILLWQNAQLPLDQQFIIADLDSRHLLVKTTEKEAIEEALNEEVRPLAWYTLAGAMRRKD